MEDRSRAPGDREEPRRITVRDRRKVREDMPPPPGGPDAGPPPGADQGASGRAQPAEGREETAAELEADLEQELKKARADADAYLEDLQRLKAEFDNYRKRIIKEQTELAERASAALVVRLLPVLDNFELAVAAAEESRDLERMLRGVELVFGELKEVLAAEGLKAIEARGKPFDPHLHEAALEVPGDEDGELVVAEVLRQGYALRGRVVRPAMVKVTRRRGAPQPAPGADEP